MITLASHKALLEKKVIEEIKLNNDEIEIEMAIEEEKNSVSSETIRNKKEKVQKNKNPLKIKFFLERGKPFSPKKKIYGG